MGESDSDDSDEDDTENGEESEKSVILNGVCQPDLNKEDAEGSSDSVNFGNGKHGDGSGGASCESGSEEEKDVAVQETSEPVGSFSEKALHSEQVDVVEMNDQTTQGAAVPCSEAVTVSYKEDEIVMANLEDVSAKPQDISVPNDDEIIEDLYMLSESNSSPVSKLSDPEETTASTNNSESPLDFDDFSSAAEMEVCSRSPIIISLTHYDLCHIFSF